MPVNGRIAILASLLVLLSPALGHGEETEQPSLELLEFLGDFTTKDGKWVDPVELSEMDLAGQEEKADESEK